MDVDIICGNMAYCNAEESLYELAMVLTEKGYNGGNIDILSAGYFR